MADEHAAALKLLQGLVDDPELRARFRADPTGVAAEAGLPRVGRELADRANGPLGLEVRESRSGLAGVLMAAAVEGLALGGLLEHAADAHATSPGEGIPEGRLASAGAPVPAERSSVGLAHDSVEPVHGSGHLPPDQDGHTAGRSLPPYVPDGDDDAADDEDERDDNEPDDDERNEDEPDENEPDENEPDEDEPDENEDDENEDERDEDERDDDEAASPRRNLAPAQPGGDDEPDAPAADVPDLPDGPQAYPGDDAPKRERAAWMAAEARDRGLPPELPVMAALVESGLQNLPGGDRDSVGYFQMRTSIWDQGDYAGYANQPERQLDWFLDHAEAVRKQRVAQGLPVDDERQYGEWVADVERPAEQYRGRYQEHLDEARALLQSGAVPAGDLQAGPQAQQALALAEAQLGRPYKWGGSTPESGFDCSGLVQWAYRKAGIELPRVTEDQVNAPGGRQVARDDVRPGDLVFFRNKSGDVHHVGISMGGDRFVHAPHTGDVVKESSLNDPYYRDEFIGGRRFAAGPRDLQRLPAVVRNAG